MNEPAHSQEEFGQQMDIVRKLVATRVANIQVLTASVIVVGALVCLALLSRAFWWALACLFGGIAVAAVLHSIMVKRWWAWAVRQDVDLDLLQMVAEDEELIFPSHTYFGRKAAAELDAVTAKVKAARRDEDPTRLS